MIIIIIMIYLLLITVGQSKHIHKGWSYPLFKSGYIYFEQNRIWTAMVFIRSLEKPESGGSISSSSHSCSFLSCALCSGDIIFHKPSLKHEWQNSSESCDHDCAATLGNLFCLILAIVEVANQHVSVSKEYFSGNIVLGEMREAPKKD